MQRDAGRLVLDEHAGTRRRDRVQVLGHAVAQRERLGRERAGEADVELGAVAADEVDLLGQARERGEVVQRAARDHGHARVGERGERAQRGDRLAARARVAGYVDDRRERAVVVAGDEQVRLAREPRERLLERLHVAVRRVASCAPAPRAPRGTCAAKRWTSCVRTWRRISRMRRRASPLGQRDRARDRLAHARRRRAGSRAAPGAARPRRRRTPTARARRRRGGARPRTPCRRGSCRRAAASRA